MAMIQLLAGSQPLSVARLGHSLPPLAFSDRAGGSNTGRPLKGCTVLLVEDDPFVGLDIAYLLSELGGKVVGPARSLARAEALAKETAVDFAVLDVNLEGELTFGLAAELQRQSVPTVFVTAYAADEFLFPSEVRDIPRLPKPIHRHALQKAIDRLL